MAGRNNGGNRRLELDSFSVFVTLYEEFRATTGFQAHRKNMHCPVMLFGSGSYKGRVASCHGPGYSSHQKLNEHLRRQHAPDLARDGKRIAPVLNRTKYNAWKAWTDSFPRKGSVLDENDMREKWWDTVVILGLQKRPKVLPEKGNVLHPDRGLRNFLISLILAHLASAADEIPFIHAFDQWLRSNRGLMSTAETALNQYLLGYSEGAEASCHPSDQGSMANPQPYASMVDLATEDNDDQTPRPFGEPQPRAQHSQTENENSPDNAQSPDLFNFNVSTEEGSPIDILDILDIVDFDMFNYAEGPYQPLGPGRELGEIQPEGSS
ncbi:hypothetical protein GQ607_008487 [Colletotrichum asianum]|uniref:Uncharacterized protein n=1 Tax=Colletotrichum asianum TaxID=702518 RepID=A0A8H3WAD3_9PEZI|nr:hypothetical protein GQ607_008487 [Colletotrichum asianum]